ncbi:NarK/NasA family nitrate transporter [Burkholderia stagnalis]|uniref:MFS transporter n=1 Tax=Burkholderia stagnalis TaxID=1503054 RepID=UPI000F59CAE6|nr:MFS transporter [Burkholderia stagnalis]RQQ23126.1 NarK/NasA family nitrate transporter [Burkholderia stagnalis]RQY47392.1 NarK/NasA family nitrate transporter [Burkholderia stagnalis]
MKTLRTSLQSGNWRSLLACFLYFDTGFTVWVLYGPLAPFIGKDIAMSAAQQGFLVAVPVLAAAILRVTLGNLYQSANGRRVALMGVLLSALPAVVLPCVPGTPSYALLLVLGVFLGIGGASFAVALPMAGSSYPPKVQGLVLGLAAAGNIGAVLDGFMFPHVAAALGWQFSTAAALPLLAIAGFALFAWADDRGEKSGSAPRALGAFAITLAGLVALVLAVHGGLFGAGKTGVLLPVMGALLAIAVLPARYRAVLAERDTWAVMLIYSITFGGFVGMSSYVTLLLTTLYQMPKIEAGLFMSLLAFLGAIVRPFGGHLADRVTGVRALIVLLAAIAAADFAFAAWMPPVTGGIALLICLYVAFGLGNGATFQLVPHRWPGKTGLLSGIVGAAGGIGGFYLPVVMGIAKESTGSYQLGFATFGALAACACGVLVLLRAPWLRWAAPAAAAPAVPVPAPLAGAAD